MDSQQSLSPIEAAWARTRAGEPDGFARWVHLCELPLRRSLRSFAAAVDVEAVLQEGLLRMWRLAPRLDLRGQNASLRFALRLVRNLANAEARRLGTVREVDPDSLGSFDEGAVEPECVPDDALRRAIHKCFGKLPQRLREAMEARVRGCADREAACALGVKINTFRQRLVRARRHLADCLRAAGIRLEDYLS